MPKKNNIRNIKTVQTNGQDRQTKILNIMMNTSLLMISLFTEAFSDVFSKMATGMVNAVTTSLGVPEENTKDMSEKMDSMKTELPKQLIEQIVTMKADINKQLASKKEEIQKIIGDPKFDEGITIVENYDFGLPKLYQDLDEISLFKYIALLKTNDPQFSKMFQELMEWMKNVPQPK